MDRLAQLGRFMNRILTLQYLLTKQFIGSKAKPVQDLAFQIKIVIFVCEKWSY